MAVESYLSEVGSEPQEDVLRLIFNNMRLPEMNRADLFAIVAGCRAGEKRVVELCERFGKETPPELLRIGERLGENVNAILDRFCAEIGRDPASITRSIYLPISYDHPSTTRNSIAGAIDAGFQHIILGLTAPYPKNAAQWVTKEFINKSA